MAYAEKRVSTAKGSKGRVTWRARYKRPDGTFGSEPGFPTKKTAERWGEEQESAIRAGRWIDPDLTRTHFGVFAHKWMASETPRGRTVMNRWERLERHVLPKWEHVPLNELTWFDVEAWARSLTCAESTVKDCMVVMSQILTAAVDARYLTVNPLYGRRRKTSATSASAGKAKVRDEDKWAPPEVVLQLARRLGPVNGLFAVATAFAGMRWGEGAGLHRANALLKRRQAHDGGWFECPVIRIHPEVGELAEYYVRDEENRKRVVKRIEPPKNATSVRDIDLPPFLADLMAAHLDRWPHEYPFCTPSGKLWGRGNWYAEIRPAADGREARAAGRGRPARPAWEPLMTGLTMRDLRHTHDTYQAQIGVNPVLAHEQAGHKYPGIKGVYQHSTPLMRQERLDGLQELFERAMKNLGYQSIWES